MIGLPKNLENPLRRLLAACETAASELKRLRMLKEYELGVTVEYNDRGDPYIEVNRPQSRA
jgi:hypothetical protein